MGVTAVWNVSEHLFLCLLFWHTHARSGYWDIGYTISLPVFWDSFQSTLRCINLPDFTIPFQYSKREIFFLPEE